MEEGHDEVVEEVLKQLEENDLYIKQEECMWKVQKVPFLGGDRRRNGGGQDGRSIEVADATVCEGCQEVSRAGQLLQTLCEELCQGHPTNELTD